MSRMMENQMEKKTEDCMETRFMSGLRFGVLGPWSSFLAGSGFRSCF